MSFNQKIKPIPVLGGTGKGETRLSFVVQNYNGDTARVDYFIDKMREKTETESEDVIERRVINNSVDLTEEDVAKWHKGGVEALVNIIVAKLGLTKEK